MKIALRLVLSVLLLPLLGACFQQGETGLEGKLLLADGPLAGAQVEVYLGGGQERSTQPFAAATSDADGRFRLTLPPGRYFLIGKKKEETGDGRVRMLMGECPANPLEVSRGVSRVPPFTVREMGRDGALHPAPGTGVQGRLVAGDKPVAGAFVYVYPEEDGGLMGPSYEAAACSADDGSFRIDLSPGRFFLAARKRADGARMGQPAAGDLNGAYPGNPVTVPSGEMVHLDHFPLQPVDAGKHRQRLAGGKFAPTGTAFSGRVVDQDGAPLAGVYVFAYLSSRMTGKPTHISAPTEADGRFLLHLAEEGTYYLGARSTFGGPMEPGERVGTYDGDPRHAAAVRQGETRPLGDLVVREVW